MSTPTVPTHVIGTAGHVDHGKSTLVKALTGIDPDRLAEEKARAMTIDLGFAHLALPDGSQASVIDVPGHERFIKNMLAGVGGIDAAVLVIAADEGPMPQTAEHLAILDLLQVERGVVALTKRDLVDDDWLALVTEEVRERLAGTALADAPIVPVSAYTGAGLTVLVATIAAVLATAPPRADVGRPRLPIDRIFTVVGFGTVVTGTLSGGRLTVGQELVVYPGGRPTRVRGLQVHGRKVDAVGPGARVAVNLANLAVEDLRRGDLLARPGSATPTQRLDVKLRLLPGAPAPLKQNDEVDFFVGAEEAPCWVTILDRERVEPGETAWLQLRFRRPVVASKGDRCIVRRPSPSETIGGGEIIDPAPPRHKRFRFGVIDALATLEKGAPDEIVLQALGESVVEARALLAQRPAGLSEALVREAITQLVAEGDVRVLAGGDPLAGPALLVATPAFEATEQRTLGLLDAYHAQNPLRRGMPKEELKSRLKLAGPTRALDETLAALAANDALVVEGQNVRRPEFAIRLAPEDEQRGVRWCAAIAAAPFAPPAPSEYDLDATAAAALVERGDVLRFGEGVHLTPAALEDVAAAVLRVIDRDGAITIATYRDEFATSRKFAQAVLEALDQRRVTRRVGDERVRFSSAGSARGGETTA